MPECVETEVTRRMLAPLLEGKNLLRVVSADPFLKHVNGICGRVQSLQRHGKVLWFHLDGGRLLGLRLSMSGALIWEEALARLPNAKPRAVFEFDTGMRLVLVDPRRFAQLIICHSGSSSITDKFDILSLIHFNPMPYFIEESLRSCRGRIRELLLNQSKIAGLGNVYANEILFAAGISPRRIACRLRRKEREALWSAICSVLSNSLKLGGISLRNYFHPDGSKGEFQKHFLIYGRKAGSPCSRCSAAIRVERKNQRSIFWCPRCQKEK